MTEEIAREAATKLIEDENNLVISTIKDNEYPSICAMVKLKHDDLKTFYFTTNKDSEKVNNLKNSNKGCIYWFSPIEYTGVAIIGDFDILSADEASISFEYFPETLKAGEYVILKFTSRSVNVYKNLEKLIIKP